MADANAADAAGQTDVVGAHACRGACRWGWTVSGKGCSPPVTDVSSPSGRPVPGRDLPHDTTAVPVSAVPFIPDWFTDWGFWIALFAGISFLLWVVGFGYAHGADYGWAQLVLAALWWGGL
jgi:hypothetical protein